MSEQSWDTTWMTAPGEEPPGLGTHREPDPWFNHFIRYLGLSFLLGAVSITGVGGIALSMYLQDRTGYRKRDVLWLFVLPWNFVVTVRTLWRATARWVYWKPRDDRPSAPLEGGARMGMIVLGWLSLVGYIAFIAALVAFGDPTAGWTSFEKTVFRQQLEDDDTDRRTAECVTDYFVAQYPDGPETMPDNPDNDPFFQQTARDAFAACGR